MQIPAVRVLPHELEPPILIIMQHVHMHPPFRLLIQIVADVSVAPAYKYLLFAVYYLTDIAAL
jgi:hypothetical protein